jgi:hypothetical protein
MFTNPNLPKFAHIRVLDQSASSSNVPRRFCGVPCIVERLGRSSQDQRFEYWWNPITLYPHVHKCSSTGLSKAEWCVDCLWFMHLRDPLGSFEKSSASPRSRASNSGRTRNHWASMATRRRLATRITLNERMQKTLLKWARQSYNARPFSSALLPPYPLWWSKRTHQYALHPPNLISPEPKLILLDREDTRNLLYFCFFCPRRSQGMDARAQIEFVRGKLFVSLWPGLEKILARIANSPDQIQKPISYNGRAASWTVFAIWFSASLESIPFRK